MPARDRVPHDASRALLREMKKVAFSPHPENRIGCNHTQGKKGRTPPTRPSGPRSLQSNATLATARQVYHVATPSAQASHHRPLCDPSPPSVRRQRPRILQSWQSVHPSPLPTTTVARTQRGASGLGPCSPSFFSHPLIRLVGFVSEKKDLFCTTQPTGCAKGIPSPVLAAQP